MLPGRRYSRRDIVRVVRRRKWTLLLPPAVGLLAVGSAARSIGAVTGVVAGLVIGLSILLILEYRDMSFYSVDEVQRTFGLPVLGTVPLLRSEREQNERRWRRVAIGIATILLGLTVVLILWRS